MKSANIFLSDTEKLDKEILAKVERHMVQFTCGENPEPTIVDHFHSNFELKNN